MLYSQNMLSALMIVFGLVLIVLVLLHSGKDQGLSGALGVGKGTSSSSLESNLTRATIFFAAGFLITALIIAFV